jgi:F-type H+-transporting ATPase subunit delta
MKITPKQYAISLYETTKNARKDEAEEMVKNFVKLLRLDNNMSKADKIIEEYYKYYRQQKGISKLKVTGSENIAPEVINSIVKHFANQVELEEEIDESLIGGITLEIDDDTLIDGSVRGKLEKLKKNIN